MHKLKKRFWRLSPLQGGSIGFSIFWGGMNAELHTFTFIQAYTQADIYLSLSLSLARSLTHSHTHIHTHRLINNCYFSTTYLSLSLPPPPPSLSLSCIHTHRLFNNNYFSTTYLSFSISLSLTHTHT
jgi:hypothetical protein